MKYDKQKRIIDILLIISYLVIWLLFILISKNLGFFKSIDFELFLTLSFLVMFFGMITKSTSWSIGNKLFNLSGDSKRHIEYSSHDNWKNSDAQKTGFTIIIDHDDQDVIKQLMTHHSKLRKEIKGEI
ncbi:TPA: hypothetical protein DCZ39_03515 [Patescibacteria group bacterium]|nr:hypothetical protein [Candidatus Gracilibacteria bacterium]